MSQQIVFTEQQGCEQLTLFQEDFPANLSALPGSEGAKKMTVTSGEKCLGLYRKSDQIGLLAKTLLVSSLWHSTKCYLTWKVSATPSKRLLFQLAVSMPRTEGTEYLLWATPNTMDSLPCRSYEAMKRQATNGGRKNRMRPGNLREQIDPLMNQAYTEARMEAKGLWPTPKAQDSRAALYDRGKSNLGEVVHEMCLYPTPTTGAGLCGGTGNFQQLQKLKDRGVITEDERKNMSQGNGGRLNPNWVEWLMGFPIGWTDLNV